MSNVNVYSFRKWYAFSKLNFITEIEEMYLNVILRSSLVVQLLVLGSVTGWETKDPTSCTVWQKVLPVIFIIIIVKMMITVPIVDDDHSLYFIDLL